MISENLAKEMHEYFKGKIVTVITQSTSLQLDKKNYSDWFTMEVAGVDSEAIWGTDINRGTRQLFFLPVIGLVEEELVKPDHPQYENIKKYVENKSNGNKKNNTEPQNVYQLEPLPADKDVAPNVSHVDSLKQKADKLKDQWQAQRKPI